MRDGHRRRPRLAIRARDGEELAADSAIFDPIDADWSPGGTTLATASAYDVVVRDGSTLERRASTQNGRVWVKFVGDDSVATSVTNEVRLLDATDASVVTRARLVRSWGAEPRTFVGGSWPLGAVSPAGDIVAIATPQRVHVLRAVARRR